MDISDQGLNVGICMQDQATSGVSLLLSFVKQVEYIRQMSLVTFIDLRQIQISSRRV